MKLQKEEAEALHKRMNTEFENLSNRIFQSKAEDFTRLNTEHWAICSARWAIT